VRPQPVGFAAFAFHGIPLYAEAFAAAAALARIRLFHDLPLEVLISIKSRRPISVACNQMRPEGDADVQLADRLVPGT
jgi:hypothetical protein